MFGSDPSLVSFNNDVSSDLNDEELELQAIFSAMVKQEENRAVHTGNDPSDSSYIRSFDYISLASASLPSSKCEDARESSTSPTTATSPAINLSRKRRQVGDDIITPIWREKIVEWCFNIVDHFRLDREVVAYAMSYLDQFLSVSVLKASSGICADIGRTLTNTLSFQLASVACLSLAIKLHGKHDDRQLVANSDDPQVLSSDSNNMTSNEQTSTVYQVRQQVGEGGNATEVVTSLTRDNSDAGADVTRRKDHRVETADLRKGMMKHLKCLSRGYFDIPHIVSMERAVLNTLQWKLHPATPVSYISYLQLLMPSPAESFSASANKSLVSDLDSWICAINDIARFQSELAVGDYNFIRLGTPSSAIGLAAVMNALDVLLLDDVARLNKNLPDELENIARCVNFSPSHRAIVRGIFLKQVKLIAGLNPESRFVSDARERLWLKIGGHKQCRSMDTPNTACKNEGHCGNLIQDERRTRGVVQQRDMSCTSSVSEVEQDHFFSNDSPKRKLCRTVSENSSLDDRGSPISS